MAGSTLAEEHLLELGTELRREREMRGVTLREISDATKVSMRYLEGLESGDSKALPATVFVRGFVREYAKYLGLSADEMVDRYLRIVSDLEHERAERVRQEHPQLREYDPTQDEGKLRAFLTVLFVLIVLGTLVALGWYFRDSLERLLPGSKSEAPAAGAVPATPPPEEGSEAAPSSTAAVQSPLVAQVEPLRMKLEFREPTWIHLLVDGETVLHETINTGTVREFAAQSQIEIRTIGNAGGVHVTLDDRELGALGASREVLKDRVFENPRAPSDTAG